MSFDLNEKHQIFPTQEGGVVVISGGVAEVLIRAEAFRRVEYAQRVRDVFFMDLQMHPNAETELAFQVRDERLKAYQIALAHGR